ncbi:unnamed protein product [Caenorhabditis bovis]|uniref:Protein kinase domain-containing protein n=1 Tax=Caenorhabditis bovis TaxID=2654633 RepID=A0A8S1F9H3_9PELO|nr:unnamed protein product [Caenorhabditis bovis]
MEVNGLENMMNRMSCRKEYTFLDDYHIVNVLGKGSYGVVYQVRHKNSHQVYALKQMEFRSTAEGIPQSVLREVHLLKLLGRKRHPSILRLHDISHQLVKDDEMVQINLLVEKCDWDLFTFLQEIPKSLPEHQCRFIAMQLFRGLEFLHSNNVIHRDLKPQNILINRDQTIRIADFGLSRNYSNTSAFTTLVVTLWYRSPEVLLQANYDSGTDIWSAGCIISELYNRQPLLPAQTEAEQLHIIFQLIGTPPIEEWPRESVVSHHSFVTYEPKPITNLNPNLHPKAAQLITECLRFKVSKRFRAAEALKHPYFTEPQREIFKEIN